MTHWLIDYKRMTDWMDDMNEILSQCNDRSYIKWNDWLFCLNGWMDGSMDECDENNQMSICMFDIANAPYRPITLSHVSVADRSSKHLVILGELNALHTFSIQTMSRSARHVWWKPGTTCVDQICSTIDCSILNGRLFHCFVDLLSGLAYPIIAWQTIRVLYSYIYICFRLAACQPPPPW